VKASVRDELDMRQEVLALCLNMSSLSLHVQVTG